MPTGLKPCIIPIKDLTMLAPTNYRQNTNTWPIVPAKMVSVSLYSLDGGDVQMMKPEKSFWFLDQACLCFKMILEWNNV